MATTKKKTTKAKSTKTVSAARRKTAARKTSPRAKGARTAARGALSMTAVAPGLTVNDVEKSLAWYRDVLGFAVKDRWEDGGKLLGVEMTAGKTTFMLGQDDWKKGRDRVKGQGVRVYCTTDQDVDRLAARIKGAGGTLAQEPKDEWGMRSLSIDDPDGYKITIARKLKR